MPKRLITAAFAASMLAGSAAVAQTATLPVVRPPSQLSWYGDPSAPDISGVWIRNKAAATGAGVSKEGWLPWPPPLKPELADVWKKRVADNAVGKRTDDPVRACLPPGMPRFITGTNGPMQIIQTPGRVTLYRDGIPVRRVWTDGRAQPAAKDLEDFSNGNAVGRYVGPELVTDLIGVKDYPIDGTGVPHSPSLKIVERYHRIDAKTLRVTVTLTDPLAYTRTMTSVTTYTALDDPHWEPREFICTPSTNYYPDKYVR
ncbi:hypothetical protein [Sphingomonas sp.]|uniref:hypothetical protein n=1 Tax=Sphingomonas sp. TaxID=28214 RepID=UPI0025E124F4|nr:hypothetical protein [Sphingomonas sp.]